jgi:drug/metabolite transporter (DMT)-like permease
VRASTIETATGPSTGEVLLLLYLGVLATLLGYIAWNIGLRSLGATRAVAFTNANAPLALTFGAVFLGEPVTVWLALGAALVVAGIATAQGASLRLFRRAGTLAPSER